MTLIITTVGPNVVTMVGDRRLSYDGKILEDDAGKMGHWVCEDASMLYAYTGVAKAGSFDLRKWIQNTLQSVAADGGFGFLAMVSRLCTAATDIFEKHPVLKKVSDKRTTIIFAGYMGNGDPAAALVSNFENDGDFPLKNAMDHFEWCSWRATKQTADASATFMTGNISGLKFSRWSELNDLVLQGRPEAALRGKSVDLLLEAASSPLSGVTIGKRLLSASLTRPKGNIPPVPSSLYITDEASSVIYGLDEVTTMEAASVAIHGMTLSFDDGDIAVFPRRRVNEPCSCGSGKKYKRCHGRRV
ncbi:SEC-C domain-containing protein [Rhizobium rhizogenes]|uniref:YecA family protein n=1 Tax=Rhizobium rhizogenes TaxID=359 RepID=UPI0022C2E5EF|nr:SEC-C domain-containing protein [Rhizobium rhizogenes]MCZ7463551.1 SEC-C domain-containing protein [Rhizobium rhizogenes]